VAPTISGPSQQAESSREGGGNSAVNTATNSEASSDSDADSIDGESRRANRINEMFDSLEDDNPPIELDTVNTAIRSVFDDGQLARQLIFAHRDRIDKIKDVVFNVSMVLLVLFIYLVLNSFVFREIISNLYSINHKTWSTSATLEIHEGVLGVAEIGSVLVNVDETNAKYPMEVVNKVTGGDTVLRYVTRFSKNIRTIARAPCTLGTYFYSP